MAFFSFCKFFSDEIENTFWERETTHSRLFESNLGHKNFPIKWF